MFSITLEFETDGTSLTVESLTRNVVKASIEDILDKHYRVAGKLVKRVVIVRSSYDGEVKDPMPDIKPQENGLPVVKSYLDDSEANAVEPFGRRSLMAAIEERLRLTRHHSSVIIIDVPPIVSF